MSGYSQKFLCCLPVRLGVFVLSLLETLCGGIVSASLWFLIAKPNGADITVNNQHVTAMLTKDQRIAAIIVAVLTSILTLVSLFGFIGSLIRKRSFVHAYSTILNIHVGISLAAGIFYIITLFRENKDELIKNCVNGSTDPNVIKLCNNTSKVKFVALGVFIVSWLIQLYGCIIVSRYVVQLTDEKEETYGRRSYGYAAPRESKEFLTQPRAGYPYADAAHSYGNA